MSTTEVGSPTGTETLAARMSDHEIYGQIVYCDMLLGVVSSAEDADTVLDLRLVWMAELQRRGLKRRKVAGA